MYIEWSVLLLVHRHNVCPSTCSHTVSTVGLKQSSEPMSNFSQLNLFYFKQPNILHLFLYLNWEGGPARHLHKHIIWLHIASYPINHAVRYQHHFKVPFATISLYSLEASHTTSLCIPRTRVLTVMLCCTLECF